MGTIVGSLRILRRYINSGLYMSIVTIENAALVEQAVAAAESLEEQTWHLSGTVANFKL